MSGSSDAVVDIDREPADRFVFDNAGRLDQVANIVETQGWRAFEPPLPEFLLAVARAMPGLVIDVGCNTGFYALLAASASPNSYVLAFEPVPEIREIARRNVAANGFADRVEFVPCAVGDRNGEAPLFIPQGDHGMVETSASLNPDFKHGHDRALTVKVRRLDRCIFSCAHRWKRVSLIKIDVEGHEAAVLDGARWLIRLRRPVIFIEVLAEAPLERLNRFVASRRYVPVRLGAGRTATPTDRIAFDPECWNQALVPREKLAAFLRYGAAA